VPVPESRTPARRDRAIHASTVAGAKELHCAVELADSTVDERHGKMVASLTNRESRFEVIQAAEDDIHSSQEPATEVPDHVRDEPLRD
jgi:hypothetical protein